MNIPNKNIRSAAKSAVARYEMRLGLHSSTRYRTVFRAYYNDLVGHNATEPNMKMGDNENQADACLR
jgi:phage baseplate assembly protein W